MNESVSGIVRVTESKGWPKRYTVVALCFAATLVCYLDRVNISVAAIAMQEALGWSETTKGLVLSSFFAGYLLFQVPSGYLANHFGGKAVLGFAVIWWSACTLLTPLAAASFPMLLVARVAMGLGEAAAFPAAYNLFGVWIPHTERSRAVAILLSGIPIGTLLALSASGWLVARYGWPSVFYVFGALGLVWAVFWFALIHNRPETHPSISDTERILLSTTGQPQVPQSTIPWSLLFSKPAIWALLINHFCSNWVLYVLLTWLPSYFRIVQGLSISSAGLASAAPWLTMFVMVNVAAWIADIMVRNGVSLTAVRKTMQTAGLLGSSAFLLSARDVVDVGTAQLLMCGALGMLAFTWSGFSPNHLDIAPRYAGVLIGITNTAGTVPGIVGVAVTGWLVEASGSYASAFTLAASISVFGAIVWLAFGTGKRVLD